MNSQQLLLTSWLDDQDGPARLTPRQQEILASVEDSTQLQEVHPARDHRISQTKETPTKQMQPQNEFLEVFYEEREAIIQRNDRCKKLAAQVDGCLQQITGLKDLHLQISTKTSPLYYDCKSMIPELRILDQFQQKVNEFLAKQKEFQDTRRIPDLKGLWGSFWKDYLPEI